MYFGFSMIIISFVFFYGWSSSSFQDQQEAAAYARYRSDDALSILPWRKWELISTDEVLRARQSVIERKLSILGPEMATFVAQQGINYDLLARRKVGLANAGAELQDDSDSNYG